MTLPLEPYSVVDLTRARSGPTCVRQLAEMGARVVKVESRAAGLTLVVGVAPTVAWPLGWKPRRMGPLGELAVLRVLATMVVVGCWTALLGPVVAPIAAWPLGAVIGCECVMTAWALGVQLSGPVWWWNFQRSSLHAGVLLLCVAVVAMRRDLFVDVLAVLLTFQVMTLSSAMTCHGLTRLRTIVLRRDEKLRGTALTEAHERLASWLHDAVTTPLRTLRVRVGQGEWSHEEIAVRLEDAEYQLRARQLDEVLATGTVQLAQVVQLHVRRAEDRGVELVEVPRFGDAGATVSGDVGRLVQRALDVLVPNAIAAGAKRLSFRITTDASSVAVEVEDDAGGFDLAAVPAGRALHGLLLDLGEGSVTCTVTDAGSRVRVIIPQEEGAT